VSIIPGIEARAPERTETSSGSAAEPKTLPVVDSMWAMPSATSARSESGKLCPSS
jgi:hypothetical protein